MSEMSPYALSLMTASKGPVVTESMFVSWRPLPTALNQAAIVAHPSNAIRSAKWFDPQLGDLIAQIKPQLGSPRTAMTVPIAPTSDLADTVVFEAPSNPAERFYLPRYSLATHDTDLGTQFRLALTRQDPGTRISLVVQPSMPPEVQAVAPDAAPLTHEVTGILSFELPGGSGLKHEWVFTDRKALPNGIELSLVLPSLPERDELYGALSTAASAARFVVRRTVTVAIPTGTEPGPGGRPRFLDQRVIDQRVIDPGRILLSRAAEEPTVGHRRRPSRLDRLRDRGAIDQVEPVAEPIPPQPTILYRATTRAIDQTLAPTPFTFSPDVHPYIYGGITGDGAQGGLVLEQLAFGGRHHSYYFSAGRPEVVYYLPDAFKLARIPEAPHPPMMSVSFDSTDGTPANTVATVVFAASAVASPARLLAAAKSLAATNGVDLARMDLQPFLADSSRLTLRVTLPGSAGSSTAIADARIDLRTALSGGFQVSLSAFQSMFDRLNGAVPRLFDGEVEVRLDRPDRAAEKVPLIVDVADMAGPLVAITPSRQAQEPRYQVSITNLIESQVRLDTVVASLPQSAGPLPCELQNPTGGPSLARGESMTAAVVPTTDPPEPEVLPDVVVVAATVTPDPAAIWEEICEDTTSHLTREVTVKTPAQLFDAAPDGSRVIALVVELGGLTGGITETVELSATATVAAAAVNVPIADLVLRSEDTGQYRYRVSTVRTDRVVDGDWKTRTSEILWIVSADVG